MAVVFGGVRDIVYDSHGGAKAAGLWEMGHPIRDV